MENFHNREEEIGEYRSKDLEFDQTESYEPPYPLTRGEERLVRMNQKKPFSSPEEWLKEKLDPIVRDEIRRADTHKDDT